MTVTCDHVEPLLILTHTAQRLQSQRNLSFRQEILYTFFDLQKSWLQVRNFYFETVGADIYVDDDRLAVPLRGSLLGRPPVRHGLFRQLQVYPHSRCCH